LKFRCKDTTNFSIWNKLYVRAFTYLQVRAIFFVFEQKCYLCREL